MTENDKYILSEFEDKLRELVNKYKQEKEHNRLLACKLQETEDKLRELQMANQQDNGPGLPQLLHSNSDYRGKHSIYIGPILYGFDSG
ncbi:MAG: hypothetical protein IKA41_05335, partial [Bacteroidaceae bacterium]|nr:hypothetical protein [Bacteroidaceae bacterium]